MKIKHYFGLAVIAAMTVSCSSNEDLGTAGSGTGTNEAGVGYATFTINLPTTSGTRAAGDPTFEDGDANEYDVFNATLLVFEKGKTAGEGNYTLAETVDLGSMQPWKNPSETGVTTQAKITAKLSHVDKSGEYFALVLLNNGSGKDAKVTLPSKGDTFSAWNAATNANATNFTDTKKGFYMANAPLYNATDKSVTTLVAIDKKKIFPTEAQASSGEAAADIYVERGLAKVTLTTATKYEDVVGSTYVGDKVTISNWALDVTNLKTFPIHNVDGLNKDYADIWNNNPATTTGEASNQRFVDNNELTKVKRVYWGTDPNYKEKNLSAETPESKTAREENFNYIKKEKLTAKPTDPLYCLENTFNLDNMMQGQTTRVIFKASYTPNGFTEEDGKTFYKIGTSVALWKEKDLEAHIKTAVSKVFSVTTDDITINLAAGGNNIKAAGNHVIKAANFTVKGHDTVTEAEEQAVNDKVGLTKDAGISTYANGESYYIARIKHFGDVLTPWKSGVYGTNNLAYLGRYGMLRNNWYVLNVQSVSGPGYPDVPDVKPNTPDDEDDKYIKVSVKILSWAKRSQDVNL